MQCFQEYESSVQVDYGSCYCRSVRVLLVTCTTCTHRGPNNNHYLHLCY
jgi:hypothetical protein